VAGATAFVFLDRQARSPTGGCSSSSAKNAQCFVTEPVVDVIIPELASSTDKNGGVNEQLNVTSGRAVTLHVQIYPLAQINISLSFRAFLSSSGNVSGITATFSPAQLSIRLNGNESSTVVLNVPQSAPSGVYPAVVSAQDVENSSWVWGSYFNINITR
jgi:hypothetical protein